jgi:voltage-gated potassium channel
MGAASVLSTALRASRFKISVFLLAVLNIVVVVGSLMYLIEGAESGFTSIPRGMYWGIVTLTTVGYGDIAPATPVGQMLASMVMVLGYAIIAVPTGIVTAEITAARLPERTENARLCISCGFSESDASAMFCRRCASPFEKA